VVDGVLLGRSDACSAVDEQCTGSKKVYNQECYTQLYALGRRAEPRFANPSISLHKTRTNEHFLEGLQRVYREV
jgi:hypothetical protein